MILRGRPYRAAGQPFELEIVTSGERLAELTQPWQALSARADGSVFQSHGWLQAWWATLPAGHRTGLRIALAWRGGEIVGALALATRRLRGLRVLEWAAKSCSDYCDALIDPACDPAELLGVLWEAVHREGGWDVAHLSHIAPDAEIGRLVADGSVLSQGRRGAASLRVRTGANSGEAWFAALSKKPRQNHRRGWDALRALAPGAAFRLVGPDEPLDDILDRLVTLKRDWLSRTGQTSDILAGNGAPLRALVHAMAEAGVLRLFLIEGEARLVAGSVNFVERGRLHAFFATYDPAFDRASPGMLVMVEYIRWAFDNGVREVDFLCGDEDYKRRFAIAEVPLGSAVAARTIAGRAALALDGAADRWRRWQAGRTCARPPSLTMPAAPLSRPARPGPA